MPAATVEWGSPDVLRLGGEKEKTSEYPSWCLAKRKETDNMEKKSWFKAVNPKYQAALDEFCENETWRSEYKNAPEYMKELLEENYYASVNFEECDKEDDEDSAWNEDRMTIDQIRYLSVHGWHPMMRSHYKELLSRRLAEIEG